MLFFNPNALGSFTLSSFKYSGHWSCLSFFYLQPALVTRFDLAYPGVTTANYMASFYFILFLFCLRENSLNCIYIHSIYTFLNILLLLLFFGGGLVLKTLPVLLGPCMQKIDVPSALHGLCFSVVYNPLPEEAVFRFLVGLCPFFLSYPHFVKITSCVFVTHLLASKSHVLAVVLLWSGVNLCLLITMYYMLGSLLYRCHMFRTPLSDLTCT